MADKPGANPVVKRKATDSMRFADSDDEAEGSKEVDDKRVKTSLDSDNFKCSICLNIWHDVICVVPCQHNFCNACFSEWYKRSGHGGCKCPQCRADIMFASKNHAMANVVEELLKNNPSLKRPQEEIEKMDKISIVKSTFMKLGDPAPAPSYTPSYGRSNVYISNPALQLNTRTIQPLAPITGPIYNVDDEDEDEEADEEDEEEEARSEDEEPDDEDRDFINDDENESQVDEIACRQCTANNSGFRCQPGTSHLSCASCGFDMPERTDIDVPQRCAACAHPCCDAYWRSQNLSSSSGDAGCPEGRLQPMSERHFGGFPSTMHKLNSVEQEFTKQYFTQRGLSVADVVKDWMAKVDRSEFALPGMHVRSDTAICDHCAEKVAGLLLDKFRMSVPKADLPAEAAGRTDCWYGHACRTQFHNINHAKKLNHMCEPTHRNVIL